MKTAPQPQRSPTEDAEITRNLATLRDPNAELPHRLAAFRALWGRPRLTAVEKESVRVHRRVLAGLVRTAGPTPAAGEVWFIDGRGELATRLPT